MALGLGRLGWSPRDFWAATPRELMAAAGLTGPRAALDGAALRDLIGRYPDPT